MSRNLDTSLAAALPSPLISPVLLVSLTFVSGVIYVWSGVGDLVWNGNTYKGVGQLGTISAITEGSEVKAEGIEVTLSGIGLSPFPADIPQVPSDVPLPVVPVTGEFTTWCVPQDGGVSFTPPFNSASATTPEDGGQALVSLAFGGPFTGPATASLSNFQFPRLPDDAVITRAYLVGTNVNEGSALFTATPGGPANTTTQFAIALSTPITPADLASLSASLWMEDTTVPPGGSLFVGPESPQPFSTYSNVGVIVYYTTSTNKFSIINETLADFQPGAPAKIYFSMMRNGALIGNPYLIFSGQVDQPTVAVSTESASITISLENRLTNLSRPTARRYTTADQHLKFPDDLGFSWVEVLNDLALIISALVQQCILNNHANSVEPQTGQYRAKPRKRKV